MIEIVKRLKTAGETSFMGLALGIMLWRYYEISEWECPGSNGLYC